MWSYRKIFIISILLIVLLLLSAYAGVLFQSGKEGFESAAEVGSVAAEAANIQGGMTVLFPEYDPKAELSFAANLTGVYNSPVIFHCYWDGELSEKHIISLKSCYFFNVLNKPHSIILWTTQIREGDIYEEAKKYCDIRLFDFQEEKRGTVMENNDYTNVNTNPSFFSDVVRYTLLYKYGGCWFDLDVFFLRSLDPIFAQYPTEVIVYVWDNQNYPNGAVFISLVPRSDKLKGDIEYIAQRNKGWGFAEAGLTFDLPLDYLVLPCSWFDPYWRLDHPYDGATFKDFFTATDKVYTFDTFCSGAFAFHWHNQWGKEIEDNSPAAQLTEIIDDAL